MSHISIKMDDMPMQIVESTEINPLISKCQIKVCYVGDEPNRNKSVITKATAEELAPTLRGCPIVGYYNDTKGDFEEHNKIIDLSNGKFEIKDTTIPYGFVPTDAQVWFQWFEDDGVPHEYLMTEGYIWTGQFPEAQRIIEKGNNQSMELDAETLNAYWTKDNNGLPQFFIINEAIMSKLCILGEDVEPCFEGASITNVQFSFENNFKNELFSLIEKMQEILSKDEGGTPVFNTYAVEIGGALWEAIYNYMWEHCLDADYCLAYDIDGIFEDNDQKFAILRNRKDLTYYRLNFSLTEEDGFQVIGDLEQVTPDYKSPETPQFALEEVQAYEADFMKKKEKPESEEPVEFAAQEEPAVVPEVTEEDDKKVEYNLDDVVEYQELMQKYSTLESKIEELNETINSLNNQVVELNTTIENLTFENNSLAEFKANIDREKKNELIASFYMLSDEQKKDCIDNIDTYSYDDIEAKLSVICVRNKVSFDLNKPEEPVTYNIDHVEDIDDSIPAWVQRVQAVAKEKNI